MVDESIPPDLEVNDNMPTALKVTADAPYHFLVVSDLGGSKEGSVSGPLSSGVVPLTATFFDEFMAEANPSVRFPIADPVAGGAMVEIDLTFSSLKAFDPRNVIGCLERTAKLSQVREVITERLKGKIGADELASQTQSASAGAAELAWLGDSLQWTAQAPSADPGAVDDVLGQLDIGGDDDGDGDGAPAPRSPIGRAVSAAAGGGRGIPAEEASALRKTLAEIDRRLNTWLTAVLHSPQLQGMEAAWRSLAFLVSQMEFRKGVRLSVLHAQVDSRMERFNSLLIDPVFDEGADAPHMIIVDEAFGSSASDLEALDEFAQHGASLPAVVLAGVSSNFFGVKHTWQIPTLPAIPNLFDQWQFAKWKALRLKPYARSLGVVFGRGLVRAPYRREEKDELQFSYKEPSVTERDLLWTNGSMAAACAVARSVAESGWPTAVAGYTNGRIERFKTCQGGKKGDKKFGPADTKLPQNKIDEMGVSGINAAVGVADHDDVLVWNGLTASMANRADHNALLEISLPYQLFAGKLSALLFDLKPHLAGLSVEDVTATVRTHLRAWIPFKEEPTEEELRVQVRQAEGGAGLEMAVTITPPSHLLPGGIPVVMGYGLN